MDDMLNHHAGIHVSTTAIELKYKYKNVEV